MHKLPAYPKRASWGLDEVEDHNKQFLKKLVKRTANAQLSNKWPPTMHSFLFPESAALDNVWVILWQ